jgi:hypothetical protein
LLFYFIQPLLSDNGLNRDDPKVSPALITTPPNSPDLPQSLSFTMNDARQFIDMVKAIVTMQIAPSPHCARSVKSPIFKTPSPPLTSLEQLLKLIQSKDSARASNGAKPDAKSGDARLKRARAKKTTEPTFYVQVWGKTSLLYKPLFRQLE